MPETVLTCLVTIKRSDVVASITTKCLQNGASYLAIPAGDYDLPKAEEIPVRMLWIPDAWLVAVDGGPHELICRKVIELDKHPELPWAKVAPPKD